MKILEEILKAIGNQILVILGTGIQVWILLAVILLLSYFIVGAISYFNP